jgi:predicted dehydrogenase
MLRVALVGCGKIADVHASQIKRIKGCEIVGACDSEPLMARQLCERFPVRQAFTSLDALLDEAQPDVVHVTTPPASHFEIAKRCLEHGCHVYVEKPFTVNAEQAETLIALAEERRLKLTVGHDDQFTPVARKMRSLVRNGYLGGPPAHMESYYFYELTNDRYARALLGDNGHWVRRLPGKLLHNVISHGIARIAEFFSTDSPQVIAHGFASPLLKSIGEGEIVDELRVIVSDGERTTAYFTFSSQIRPSLHQFRVFGRQNGIVIDRDQETLLKLRGARFKSYAEIFIPPVSFSLQYLKNLAGNARAFLAQDLHMKSGMEHLITSFYASILEGAPVPIPTREIILTARIMDQIFEQIAARRPLDNYDAVRRPRALQQETPCVPSAHAPYTTDLITATSSANKDV